MKRFAIISVLILLLVSPNKSDADDISFELQVANPAVSIFRLRNTSPTSTAVITSIFGYIGDTSHNFDIVSGESLLSDSGAQLTWSLDVGDNAQGGMRTDEFMYSFGGFDTGDRFQFQTDLDLDNQNTDSDFRNIYFNNGSTPNATFEVSFRSGNESGVLTLELPDDDLNGDPQTFLFNVSGSTVAVPEPTTAVLLFGVALSVSLRRRRRFNSICSM